MPLTLLSLLVAMLVVGAGVFAIGHREDSGPALLPAVLSTATADIGLIAYEMARLVKRVGEHLHTPERFAGHPPTAG